jgi:hypothetical protein
MRSVPASSGIGCGVGLGDMPSAHRKPHWSHLPHIWPELLPHPLCDLAGGEKVRHPAQPVVHQLAVNVHQPKVFKPPSAGIAGGPPLRAVLGFAHQS